MTIPLSWKLIDEFIELSNWRQAVETEIEVGEKSGSKKMKKKRLKTILDFGSFSTVRTNDSPTARFYTGPGQPVSARKRWLRLATP